MLIMKYYANKFSRSFYCQFRHHTSHFSLGFILLPSAQLKAFENSLELLRVPMILKQNLLRVKLANAWTLKFVWIMKWFNWIWENIFTKECLFREDEAKKIDEHAMFSIPTCLVLKHSFAVAFLGYYVIAFLYLLLYLSNIESLPHTFIVGFLI